MPVRWSSTYLMLLCADKLKEAVDTFVYEIAHLEKGEKHVALDRLQLSNNEWDRVRKLVDLLTHSDNAQHTFSSDSGPTLHLALPAHKALHRSWTIQIEHIKYNEFKHALEVGTSKIAGYYDRTADSEVYIFAMFLDPSQKKSHIQRYWGEELLQQALKHAETIYATRYKKLYPDGSIMTQIKRTTSVTSAAGHVKCLIDRELSDDEDDLSETGISDNIDPMKPWLHDFHGYLDSVDDLGNCSILNAGCYPVWTSLARDYLAVMTSSVLSDRAFSSTGITISKQRNRLKADVVEALQFLKCAICCDLLFRESPSLLTEADVVDETYEPSQSFETPWDDLIEDISDGDDAEILGGGMMTMCMFLQLCSNSMQSQFK
ncbi:hypothetical protein WOLCODRAFT_83227 [Wolfiporia cocos MD-104 SS10]|uniref:HAT C-terminal dimerisation domain-containing protein n=1 Tax=Wolfiporia cocos (strain MD-104) TaxID=742152 RepID=A0A2H3JJK2_WOLCO|nr:hypothetical protein WOLCODRAFT_83227 [Wolfiporia cocos MD-104 SS10]